MTEIDLRVIKTLECIDNSLLKNLNCLSFTKLTVDMICKEAKINRSTFYKYYKDKYDLLDKYIDRILKEFTSYVQAEFITAVPSDVGNALYNAKFKNLLVLFNRNKDIYITLWDSSLDRNVYSEMTSIIQNNLLNNLNSTFHIDESKKSYTSLFSYLLASNLMTLTNWWLNDSSNISIDEVVDLMADITSKGTFITLRNLIK